MERIDISDQKSVTGIEKYSFSGAFRKETTMSRNSFTEVTYKSWFSRIGEAFKGILVGLVFVIAALALLFWNEGRSVKRYKTLEEGGGVVVSVTSDRVEAANDGNLIHVTGRAETDAILTDPVFGVSVPALKLKRVVEMYQWKETSRSETQKEVGGGTRTVETYSYSRIWSDQPIHSGDFSEPAGHQNPGAMPYESLEQIADHVSLGAFTLPDFLLDKIQNFEPLPAGAETLLPESLKNRARLYDAGFYLGPNPASPQIGDTRITFRVARPTEVSVIARQMNRTFEEYPTSAGGAIALLQTGIHTADAMIQSAQSSNKIMAWMLRFVGFILMLIGLNLVLKPLSVLADMLPVLGNVVGAGSGVISFLLAGILSLLTIGIAWVVYRPVLGIILILAAAALTMAIRGKLKSANPGPLPVNAHGSFREVRPPELKRMKDEG